jgi:hypothetical protein
MAMAPMSASPWRSSISSAVDSRGRSYEIASVPNISPAGARSGAAAMPRRPIRLATDWSSSVCGMRGSTR